MIEVYTKDGKQTFEKPKGNEYKNALNHANRKDGPAIIKYFNNGNIQYKAWYLNGKLNQADDPAIISYYENGYTEYKAWYINGKCNQENGPAVITYYNNGNVKTQEWYLNSKQHREDGPAVISYDINGKIKNQYFYLNDKEYSFEDWENKVKVKEIKLKSQAELMKQMAKDKVPYNGQEYYISTTSNKPIVYTIKESKIFESFKESYNKLN